MSNKDSLVEDENKPEGETGKSQAHNGRREVDEIPSPSINPVVTNTEKPKSADSYDETDRKQDEAIDSLAEQTQYIAQQTRWMARQTYWTMLSAIFSLVLGALTLGVLVYHGLVMSKQSQDMRNQTEIMKRQLESMNSSSAQTQEMIDATHKMADASQTTAEQNKELVAQSGKQADAAVAEAQALGVQARLMSQQARSMGETLKQTKVTREVENRPYIVVTRVSEVDEKFGPFVVELQFENTGRTPALYVEAHLNYGYLGTDPPYGLKAIEDSPPEEWDGPYSGRYLIPAGTTYTKKVEFRLTEDQEREFGSGFKYPHVWGNVAYKDIFGRTHNTEFCVYVIDRQFFYCPTGNAIK
jgi:hypothetical protein